MFAADGDQVLVSVALEEMDVLVLRDAPESIKHLCLGEVWILWVKTQLFQSGLEVVGCLHFGFKGCSSTSGLFYFLFLSVLWTSLHFLKNFYFSYLKIFY